MQPQNNEIEIELASPHTDKDVLAAAALAWPETDRAASWQEIRQAAAADSASVVLLAARQGPQLVGAALAHVLPGKAAIVWPPQWLNIPSAQTPTLSAALLRRLTELVARGNARFVQALLPSGDDFAAEPFARAGFRRAAELLYLSGETAAFPDQAPRLPVELRPADEFDERQLCELIDRTYVGTLDCPQIDGLRETTDVVHGYRAVGQYRPELWQLAYHEGRAVGCLLVNVHPDVRHAELVYFGLVPEVRGKGWGLLLTQQALWLAKRAECDRLVLAVDAANAPAIGIYLRAGLTEWDRREIWICPLGEVASA
jgi:mycothiol synthase